MRCYKLFLVFTMVIFSIPSYTQISLEHKALYDSLFTQAKNLRRVNSDSAMQAVNKLLKEPIFLKYDSLHVQALRQKGLIFKENNKDSASYYLNKSYDLAKHNKDTTGICNALMNMAELERSNFLLADSLFRLFDQHATTPSARMAFLIIIANYEKNKGNLAAALNLLNQADELEQKHPTPRYRNTIIDIIAKIYVRIGDYEGAVSNYRRLFEDLKIDRHHIPWLIGIGATLTAMDSTKEAKFYLKKALELQPKQGSKEYTYFNIIACYLKEEKIDSAKIYLKKFKETEDDFTTGGRINFLLKKSEIESIEGEFSTLLKHKSELHDFYQKQKDYMTLSKLLHDCLYATSSMEDRIILDSIQSYRDKLEKSVDERALVTLEIKSIEQEEKLRRTELEKNNELQELKISNQKKMLFGFGTAGALLLFLSGILYRLFKTNQSKQKQLTFLNRELNHRVKNNLAFMTSLLEMQGRRVDNIETKQILQESESRLKALSIVHSNLFQNENDTQINLKNYLEEIVTHLQNIFEIPAKSLEIETHFTSVTIDAEDAMRVGLILNELVTNSVKHAFLDIDTPKIIVETIVQKDKKINLRYKDNGPIIQKESISTDASPQSTSIGLKLIELLKRQLNEKLVLSVG